MPTEKNLLAHAPTQPAMPAQPRTVAVPPPPPWAIALTEKVVSGFEKVDVNLALVTTELNVIRGRVENLEKARDLDEQRAAANSMKVKQISDSDLSTVAKIADVISWRSNVTTELATLATTVTAHGVQLTNLAVETAEQTATLATIKGAVVGVITNKKVIFVGKTLFVLAVALAGYLKGH